MRACVRAIVPSVCVYLVIHLQLSSCIMHVWTSIGKFFKSMGQDRVSVSLMRGRKTKIGGRLEKTQRTGGW